VDDVFTVSEKQIRAAIIRLLETGKTVAEGAAAAAFAALACGSIPRAAGRKVTLVLSGSNIDLALLSSIIDRSMVESHRLVRVRTHVPDRPGALGELLTVIGHHGGNVMRIQHDRIFMHGGFWEAQVDLTLETRNLEHIQELEAAMGERGYKVVAVALNGNG
jgi:threonine dehydratase